MNTELTQERKSHLLWVLSSIYGVTFFFYLANFYSFAVLFTPFSIVCATIALGSLFGVASLALDAYFLSVTGKWLGGNADYSALHVAVVYSKLPALFLLGLWIFFLAVDPMNAFIQDTSNGAAVTIVFSSLLVNLCSFVLLFKHLKNLQGFSNAKTFGNLSLLYLLVTFVYVVTLFVGRYVYLAS